MVPRLLISTEAHSPEISLTLEELRLGMGADSYIRANKSQDKELQFEENS